MIITTVEKLIEAKQKALLKTSNELARKAIEFEIKQLQNVLDDFSKLQAENNELKEYSRTTNEAKAIAEMVCLIHGVPEWDIQNYYRMGVIETLNKLEELFEENETIIPVRLKHLRK